MKQLLVNFSNYNHWANERVCSKIKVSGLSILDTETKSSFSTIRKTLYHIWDAETIWYKRLNGESLYFWPSEKFNDSFDDFIWQFLSGSMLLNVYINGKTYAELLADITYSNTKGIKYKNQIAGIIQHCLNHSTHHRGQIYTMLRGFGISDLPSIDYITFLRENTAE